MKTSLLSAATAFAFLFSASSAVAAPALPKHDNKPPYSNGRDHNYGYDKNHKVTAAERARWEAAQRHDHRDDYKKDDKKNNRRDDQRYDRDDRNQNYGYDKNHQVTASERARWEAAQRHDRRR